MSASAKKITLKSCDEEAFDVEAAVAMESLTLRHMIEDGCAESEIPIPNVTGKILAKVIAYCKKHAEAAVVSTGDLWEKIAIEDLKTWDEEFIKVDRFTLFDIVLAANYLNVKSLLDLTCKQIANMIRGKNVEEIREVFSITNDYTSEEEEEMLVEYAKARQPRKAIELKSFSPTRDDLGTSGLVEYTFGRSTVHSGY